MVKIKLSAIILLTSVSLLSYSEETKARGSFSTEEKVVKRDVDPVRYSQGTRLYQLNCATCHGLNAEGAKDWRKADDNGKNPAPPLNGTGHTWHHSTKALFNVIRNGTGKIGGNMPAWKDKLSNNDIKLILTWVTAQWPDEIYTAWYNRFHQNK
ncbi:MAG: cytochrome c [Gammaproteobacteria bacterium]|nr:cytochrome c [Gammaproteobacteria bacterium]